MVLSKKCRIQNVQLIQLEVIPTAKKLKEIKTNFQWAAAIGDRIQIPFQSWSVKINENRRISSKHGVFYENSISFFIKTNKIEVIKLLQLQALRFDIVAMMADGQSWSFSDGEHLFRFEWEMAEIQSGLNKVGYKCRLYAKSYNPIAIKTA